MHFSATSSGTADPIHRYSANHTPHVYRRCRRCVRSPSRSLSWPSAPHSSLLPRRAVAYCQATTSTDVIPRDVLFVPIEYASPMLSPDGKLLAYLRPDSAGVLNVWCRTIGTNDDRVVTQYKYRGVRQAFWAEDSTTLLFMQDDAGDENFHLFAIDATEPSSVARDLTPFPGAKAQNVITNKRYPDTLLVGVNKRNPAMFDMYRCDLKSGELTLDTENPGNVLGWGSEDESFEIREAVVMNQADSSSTVKVRDSKEGEWRELIHFPYGEEGNMIDFSKDGKSALVLSSLGRETTALQRLDIATGEVMETIASSEKCNTGGILLDDDTKEVRVVSFNYARTERTWFDKGLEADFKKLEAAAPEGSEITLASKHAMRAYGWSRTVVTMSRRVRDITRRVARLSRYSSPCPLYYYTFARMEDVRSRRGWPRAGRLPYACG